MSLYDKLSEKSYPIGRAESKAGCMMAFDRSMEKRVKMYRYPATRRRPNGLMRSKTYGPFRHWKRAV